MQIEVIQADYHNPKHASDLTQLLNAYANDPMGGGQPLAHTTQTHLIAELAKRSHVFSIICYVDQQPAGIVNCVEGFSTFACKPLINIHDLAVSQEFRGLGISQRLLQKVEQIARQKDCCKITLEVLEGNEVAKNAYLKHGFAGYELDPEQGKAMFWQKVLAS